MNEKTKAKLEEAVASCATKAANAENSIDAKQYSEAALNAADSLSRLSFAFSKGKGRH